MRKSLAALLVLAALAASPAAASAPETSLRPASRPAAVEPGGPAQVLSVAGALRSLRPEARPTAVEPAGRAAGPAQVLSTAGVLRSPRPEARPRDLQRGLTLRVLGLRTQPDPDITIGRRGALCGTRGIEGVKLSAIAGRVQGCGLAEPVRVTAVSGIPLSQPATIDCTTALALQTWVEDALVPTVGRKGGGVARIDVFASYACRPRNNQKGARVSEHGRGRAIDIGGITLKNGTTMTVLSGWRDKTQGPILRDLHRAACGPFGTVLGPNSDRFHQNHFHFDTASYRSGPYCR